MTTFRACANCGKQVIPTSEGMCPSCRKPFKEDTTTTPSVHAMPGVLKALVGVFIGGQVVALIIGACGGGASTPADSSIPFLIMSLFVVLGVGKRRPWALSALAMLGALCGLLSLGAAAYLLFQKDVPLLFLIVGVLYACGGLFLLSSPFVLRTPEVRTSFGMRCEACGSYKVKASGSEQGQRTCKDCGASWGVY